MLVEFIYVMVFRNTYVLSLGVALKIRFNRLVLFVEVSQVRDQVLDNVSVWQRVDA